MEVTTETRPVVDPCHSAPGSTPGPGLLDVNVGIVGGEPSTWLMIGVDDGEEQLLILTYSDSSSKLF